MFTLKITQNLKIIAGLNEHTTEYADPIVAGEWNDIYLSFVFTVGGTGLERNYINGVASPPTAYITDAPTPLVFRNLDTIMIGGEFKGHLRRIQIYSPGTFGVITGDSIFSFFFLLQ